MEPSSNKRTKLVNIMLLIALFMFCSNSTYISEFKSYAINKQQTTTNKESEKILLKIREKNQKVFENEIKDLELSKNEKREKEISKSKEIESDSLELEFFEKEEAMEYTEQELEILATLIYAEAGGCDDVELYRVANVVINRVNNDSNMFENTIEGVIYQSGQFSSVGGEAWNRGASKREYEIAKDVLEGKRVLPKGVVWFSKQLMYGEKYDTPSKWHVYSSM